MIAPFVFAEGFQMTCQSESGIPDNKYQQYWTVASSFSAVDWRYKSLISPTDCTVPNQTVV